MRKLTGNSSKNVIITYEWEPKYVLVWQFWWGHFGFERFWWRSFRRKHKNNLNVLEL